MLKTILNLFDSSYALNVNTYGAGGADTNMNTNRTDSAGLSAEMKTYYSDYLIDLAEPYLVHDRFGQKRPIPANGGKSVEFRKYAALPKATTPLTEGVTPDGQSLSVTTITAQVAQYGGYVALSDMLLMTAIDKNLVEATQLLASQAGRTLDTITREVINAGTQVVYAAGGLSRAALVGGESSGNNYLTVDDVRKAVRTLKVMNAPKINGWYWGIIHPDVAYDLMSDPEWRKPHEYVDTANIYEGEIGAIAGVRFVESTEAKIFNGSDLASDSRTLTVNNAGGYSGAITSIAFDGGTVAGSALVGRTININGVEATITANTTSALTFASTNFGTIANDALIYPGGGGKKGVAVYSTLIIGNNAYGVTEIQGGGLRHIVKQLGSAGSGDPLDQRATAGWKATKTAEILVDQYLCRIESASTFSSDAN